MQAGPPSISFPTPDWNTLVPNLIGLMFDAVGKWFDDALHRTFDGMWGSSANVIGQTDMAMTWGFGPVHDQVMAIQGAARAVLLFALILMGLRGMLSSIVPQQPDMLAELINGVLAAVIFTAAFPLLVPEIIGAVNQGATAVGTVDLSKYLRTGLAQDPVVNGVLFVILLFFGIKLLFWAVWRTLALGVLLPAGMLACIFYAIPQWRWMLGWWCRTWGGLLLAQIPSVMALTIGAQLFAFGSGINGFVYSIAAMALATDLYRIVPNAVGAAGGGSAPWGQLPLIPLLTGGMGGRAKAAARTVHVSSAHQGIDRSWGSPDYGY